MEQELDNLKEEMSPWVRSSGETENLLRPVASLNEDVRKDIQNFSDLYFVEGSQSKEQLKSLSSLVETSKSDYEDLETYKKRISIELKKITNNGTPLDIINALSSILNIRKDSIELENESSNKFVVRVPAGSITIQLSPAEIDELFGSLAASTYDMELLETGTLEYITPEQYGSISGEDVGYADPESPQEGGTYSGQNT